MGFRGIITDIVGSDNISVASLPSIAIDDSENLWSNAVKRITAVEKVFQSAIELEMRVRGLDYVLSEEGVFGLALATHGDKVKVLNASDYDYIFDITNYVEYEETDEDTSLGVTRAKISIMNEGELVYVEYVDDIRERQLKKSFFSYITENK